MAVSAPPYPGSAPPLTAERTLPAARVPTVAVLLSTFNGEQFLDDQLQSLLRQTVADWVLYWRDDGSSDTTVDIMRRFMAGPGAGRCHAVLDPPGRLRPTGSFMALLRAAVKTDVAAVAFADQDDVWLPEKLSRAVAALQPDPRPALYCSRQLLVDEALRHIGVSARLHQPPGFPAALTQNVATGCTLVLNQAAARLVAGSRPPPATLHDWWSYLVVSAHGGRVVADATPTVLYRQHGGNAVGAPASMRRRFFEALRRGPGAFMAVLRGHVAALRAQPDLLTPDAAAALDVVQAGLQGGVPQRLAALQLGGLSRQTWQETLMFRLWFLVDHPPASPPGQPQASSAGRM